MFDIFRIQHNNIEITPEILTLKPFRDIYIADNHPSKKLALKIFLYIYHSTSYKSLGVRKGYEGAELHNFAIKNSDLDNTFIVTKEIKEAMKCYKDNQYTPIDEELSTLNKITVTRNEALTVLSQLLKLKSKKLSTDEKEFNSFFELSEKVSTFTSKIEKDFDIIQNLQQKLLTEENTAHTIYGKKVYTQSLDNDKDLQDYEREE